MEMVPHQSCQMSKVCLLFGRGSFVIVLCLQNFIRSFIFPETGNGGMDPLEKDPNEKSEGTERIVICHQMFLFLLCILESSQIGSFIFPETVNGGMDPPEKDPNEKSEGTRTIVICHQMFLFLQCIYVPPHFGSFIFPETCNGGTNPCEKDPHEKSEGTWSDCHLSSNVPFPSVFFWALSFF